MDEPDRYQRRKASTRAKIVIAADELFQAKGYTATGMDEISSAAGVAIRTIYLHFDSKAAVLLAQFDEWLEEFLRRFAERPADEALDVMLEAVLQAMLDAGWGGNRTVDQMIVLHPVINFMGGKEAPEIAGHILQRWVDAQDQLTEQFRQRGNYAPDALEPRIQAAAVYTAWTTAMLTFRDHHRSRVPLDYSTHEVGNRAMRAMVEGLRRAWS